VVRDSGLEQQFDSETRFMDNRCYPSGLDPCSPAANRPANRVAAPIIPASRNDQISCPGDIELLLLINKFASPGVGFCALREEKFHAVAVGRRP
jgi:hypothetical protein